MSKKSVHRRLVVAYGNPAGPLPKKLWSPGEGDVLVRRLGNKLPDLHEEVEWLTSVFDKEIDGEQLYDRLVVVAFGGAAEFAINVLNAVGRFIPADSQNPPRLVLVGASTPSGKIQLEVPYFPVVVPTVDVPDGNLPRWQKTLRSGHLSCASLTSAIG